MTAVEPVGQRIYSVEAAPDPNIGIIGDFWIDRLAHLIYGPKTQGGWGDGVALTGTSSNVVLDGAGDGDVLVYDADTDEWAPRPLRYTYRQDTASDVWTITHSLGFKPQVSVVDSGDNVVVGDVAHLSDNALTISFSAVFGGIAYLS
jgi:hypothetical protein